MNVALTDIYKKELELELQALLDWWITYMPDEKNGGFYGKVNNDNTAVAGSPKGLVLNARILWTFSAAFLQTQREDYLFFATRAFHYLVHNFLDDQHTGFYWSVDETGKMLDGRKQIYGQAFAIYGLSEYYRATKNEEAIRIAKDTFTAIEKYSFDPVHDGYFEAFTKEWGTIEDLRLSARDLNEKKSMNTHLHIAEAYANLYLVDKDERVADAIKKILNVFTDKIIDKNSYQQQLFFTEDWSVRSSAVSFGHDIEAAWLLQETAAILNDKKLITTFKDIAIKMTDASMKGIDSNGGMWHEYDTVTKHWIKEKHWWPQAEAMVGFFNAWQLTGEEKYLHRSLQSWQFTQHYLKEANGEWRWGINEDYSPMQAEDKAGFWKCPYHNGRACMEIIKRIGLVV